MRSRGASLGANDSGLAAVGGQLKNWATGIVSLGGGDITAASLNNLGTVKFNANVAAGGAVSDPGQIVVAGTATLDGLLEFVLYGGFDPIAGSTFDLIRAEGSTDILRLAAVQVVPVPGALWLFGSAVAGLGWIRRRSLA